MIQVLRAIELCSVAALLAACDGAPPLEDAGRADSGSVEKDSGGPDAGAIDRSARLATEVIEAPGAHGGAFGDPARAANGVRGGGEHQGSFDVFSLDYGDGAQITLGFAGGARFVDGEGADIVVFENAFRQRGSAVSFMDLAIVSVSPDGAAWIDLPHDYVAPDEAVYSNRAEHWTGFAGRTPVLLHEENHRVDPFDAAAAGGDAFDLSALAQSADPVAARVLREGVRAVRITSAPARTNPDTGAPYPSEVVSNGADVDGVYARGFVD